MIPRDLPTDATWRFSHEKGSNVAAGTDAEDAKGERGERLVLRGFKRRRKQKPGSIAADNRLEEEKERTNQRGSMIRGSRGSRPDKKRPVRKKKPVRRRHRTGGSRKNPRVKFSSILTE